MEFFAVIQTKEKKRTLRNQDNKESFSIPFPEKNLLRREKAQKQMEDGAHFCMYASFPWSFSHLFLRSLSSYLGQLVSATTQ